MQTRSKNKSKRTVFPVLMGIIWGILIVVFILITKSIRTRTESYCYLDGAVNCLANEEYGQFVRSVMIQRTSGLYDDKKPDMGVIDPISHYMEAAGMYKMYVQSGDVKKADYYRAKMNSCREKMGRYAECADWIDRYLNLEQ